MTSLNAYLPRWRRFAPLLLIGWLSPAAALNPVANFDLNRYMGTWYEIAAIRGFLQSRCAREVARANAAVDFSGACYSSTSHWPARQASSCAAVVKSMLS